MAGLLPDIDLDDATTCWTLFLNMFRWLNRVKMIMHGILEWTLFLCSCSSCTFAVWECFLHVTQSVIHSDLSSSQTRRKLCSFGKKKPTSQNKTPHATHMVLNINTDQQGNPLKKHFRAKKPHLFRVSITAQPTFGAFSPLETKRGRLSSLSDEKNCATIQFKY